MTVAVVTGATRGIGFEVCRQLAERGTSVILTGRSLEAAQAAAAKLAGLAGAVRAAELDISSPAGIERFAGSLPELDILVNNAAAPVDWSETASTADMTMAQETFATNLFGTWRLTQALLPLLRQSGHARIVNVSSGAGSHGDDAYGLTTRSGAAASYGISKAAINGLTATFAAELAGSGVLINSVCPGLTATWPGAEQMGARPVSEGAAGIVWAATLADDGPTGGFFRDGAPLPW